MTQRSDYLEALAGALTDLGPAVVRMLRGEEEVEPSVLLSVVQSAALALHPGAREELPKDVVEIARGVVGSARQAPGRDVLGRVFDALDLDEMGLEVDPDDEPEVLQSRLHDLFELGFLVDVLNGERRERLVEALEMVAAEVLGRDEVAEVGALYETAFLLGRLVELPEEHPVAELLATIEAASDELAHLEPGPDAAEVAAIFRAAQEKYEAALSPLDRFVRWGREAWGAVTEWFAAEPLRVLAATAKVGPRWPRARVVLGGVGNSEVGLVVEGDEVLVEVAARELPDPLTVRLDGGGALTEVAARHPGQRLWALPDGVDFATAVVIGVDGVETALAFAAGRPVQVAHAWSAARRLRTALALAPGAVRAELTRLAGMVASESLGLALELEAQADLVDVHAWRGEVGQAAFVVVPETAVPEDALSPGFLVRVTAAGLAVGVPAERFGIDSGALDTVARWVGELVGAPLALTGAGLDLRFQVSGESAAALAIEGDSWQLAAALAVISERLGVVAKVPLVASGALGDGAGQVLPVARVADKRAVVDVEVGAAAAAGDAEPALVVGVAQDLRPVLGELFGDDWHARLAVALGVAPAASGAAAGDTASALSRAAIKAWRGWFGQRNAMAAGAECERALGLAEQALAAGVAGVHRVQALWVAGACRLHRGESARAAELFDEVDAALMTTPTGQVPAFVRAELAAYRGIALVDGGRPNEAVALLEPVLESLDRVAGERPELADRRFVEVRLQVAGTLQRAVAFAGDLGRARELLLASLASCPEEQRARTLGDLAEVERRAGELDAARTALAAATDALEAIDDERGRAFTARFLGVYAARAGLAGGALGTAVEAPKWNAWPQPIEVLETLIAGPEAELVGWVERYVVSVAGQVSTIHLLVVLGAVARAGATTLMPGLVQALAGRDEVEPEVRAQVAALADGVAEAVAAWVKCCPY